MIKFLFIAFLAIPIIEIYVLITVGSAIGAVTTISLILFTALLGAVLVRAQGFATFARVQGQLAKGEVPAIEIIEGLFLLVAGALLLTPGFVTDAIGFVCLTPPLRRAIIRRMLAAGVWKGKVQATGAGNLFGGQFTGRGEVRAGSTRHGNTQPGPGQGRIIDGEYRDLDQ